MKDSPLIISLLIGLIVILVIAGVSLLVKMNTLSGIYKKGLAKNISLEKSLEDTKAENRDLSREIEKFKSEVGDLRKEVVGLQEENLKLEKLKEKLEDNLKDELMKNELQEQ
jgi:cell division protein FtsB